MKIYNACPSGKVGYLDELDAMLAVEELARRRDHRDKHERNQYDCPQCPHWHLTSGPVS